MHNLSAAKRRTFQVLTVVLTLLICLICLEIGLRILGPKYHAVNRSDMYYSNPRGYFDALERDGDQVLYGIKDLYFEVNPIFRRVPDDLDRSNNDELTAFLARESKVLGLGDSFTYGHGVRYEDTYLRLLEKRVSREDARVGIVNAACPGFDLEEIVRTYSIESSVQPYPLVVYGLVLNDFGLPGREKIVGPDYIDFDNSVTGANSWRGRSATFHFICQMIERFRLDRVTRRCYLDAFQGDNARAHFALLRELHRQVHHNGGELAIVLFPLLYDFHDYPFQGIHDKIRDFCQAEDIRLLDLLASFAKHTAQELWVHPIDHHPNEIAHQIAAEELYAFLKREEFLDAALAKE